jgi:GNAT superfamily N-acetyltransferase
LIIKEPRIRAATADDVSAITQIVGPAYRHYIARMGKPPGPMLNDYSARVSQGVVWVLEEGTVIAAIIVLLPTTDYLLLDDIAVSPARQGLGLGQRLLASRRPRHRGLAIPKSGSTPIKRWRRINATTLQSVMKRRDAARRPAMTASSCASSFADNDFVRQL